MFVKNIFVTKNKKNILVCLLLSFLLKQSFVYAEQQNQQQDNYLNSLLNRKNDNSFANENLEKTQNFIISSLDSNWVLDCLVGGGLCLVVGSATGILLEKYILSKYLKTNNIKKCLSEDEIKKLVDNKFKEILKTFEDTIKKIEKDNKTQLIELDKKMLKKIEELFEAEKVDQKDIETLNQNLRIVFEQVNQSKNADQEETQEDNKNNNKIEEKNIENIKVINKVINEEESAKKNVINPESKTFFNQLGGELTKRWNKIFNQDTK